LLAQRKAELDIVRQQIKDTTILAPFDGVVQERRTHRGEFLSEGSPVVALVRIDPLRLRFEVSERDALKVKENQKVRVRLEGDPKTHEATISRLSPALNSATRMLVGEADLPNAGTLRPGAFARVEVVVETDSPGLAIPKSALITFAGLEKVYLLQDGKVTERSVTSGGNFQDRVEIVQGLKEGDRIVLKPDGVRPGDQLDSSASL
jgi:membrane fusion protein (multidrug efflux system)